MTQELAQLYAQWSEANQPFMGFWGNWPRYFEEMPLTQEQIQAAASRCGTALVVIGRAAGESRENTLEARQLLPNRRRKGPSLPGDRGL